MGCKLKIILESLSEFCPFFPCTGEFPACSGCPWQSIIYAGTPHSKWSKKIASPTDYPDLSSVSMETGQRRWQERLDIHTACSQCLSLQLSYYQLSFVLMKIQDLPHQSIGWDMMVTRSVGVWGFSHLCCSKKGTVYCSANYSLQRNLGYVHTPRL